MSGALDKIQEDTGVQNSVNPSFIDKTQEYGLSGLKASNFNVVDINEDGYSDLVILKSFYSIPEFYLFDIGARKFKKTESLFPVSLKASFLLFYDVNKDNVLDVFVGVLNQKSELAKNPLRLFLGEKENGTLKFIEKDLNIKATPNSTLGLIDYNLDGHLDLFLGNWFTRYKDNPIPHHDQLYVFKKDKWEEKSELLSLELKKNVDQVMFVNATPTYGSQVCDMDQNGFPDILTTSTNRYKNKLWINKYKFRERYRYFENIGEASGFASDKDGQLNNQGGGRTFGLACADYNNDGIMDVFLGELAHNYDHQGIDKSSLLTGRTMKKHPRFFRTEYFVDALDPNWHQADRRGLWVDINNDGLDDLIVDNSGYPPHSKLILFKQLPDHSFENTANNLGVDIVNPTATVTADFNKDGKMDLLTARSSIRDASILPRIYLLENNIDTNKNKSVRIILRGKKSNTHGLNAMVILRVKKANEISERRKYVSYSYGALSPQNEEGVHFGLEADEKLLGFKVRWPYARNIDVSAESLEKEYTIKHKFTDTMTLTLCESGAYYIGPRKCQ